VWTRACVSASAFSRGGPGAPVRKALAFIRGVEMRWRRRRRRRFQPAHGSTQLAAIGGRVDWARAKQGVAHPASVRRALASDSRRGSSSVFCFMLLFFLSRRLRIFPRHGFDGQSGAVVGPGVGSRCSVRRGRSMARARPMGGVPMRCQLRSPWEPAISGRMTGGRPTRPNQTRSLADGWSVPSVRPSARPEPGGKRAAIAIPIGSAGYVQPQGAPHPPQKGITNQHRRDIHPSHSSWTRLFPFPNVSHRPQQQGRACTDCTQ